MGEVYKATDTRLKRTVAIKVLPPHFAQREDLRLRFEREARVISNLNHPHICTLYDIGQQDGMHFLVMEHLEGETLAARIRRGPLALDEALPLAIQIAGALSEAHTCAVAHRDLKPANVMLTRTGVKLLDFGLAKPLTAGKNIGPEDATLTAALSTEGAFMGTLQYMAPEQLEGKEADARSDIFAFGCVLYEMLTGNRAFTGESHASVIGAIMSGEPPALTQLQPLTPAGLERVVRQCMRKKAEERLQSAHDIRLHLEWLRQPVEEKPAAAPPPPPKPRIRERWLWGAVISLGAALAAAVAVLALRPGSPPAPGPVKLEIQTKERGSTVLALRVSPGGETIAWNARVGPDQRLYVRSLSTGVTRPLSGVTGTPRAFSPDGRSLLVDSGGSLKRVDLAGGGVQTVCDCQSSFGADWSQSGNVFLGNRNGPLLRVPASGGKPVPALALDKERGESSQRVPVILAEERSVLYTSRHANRELDGVYLAPLDGSQKPRRVHSSPNQFQYIHPDVLLVRHGEGLAAVRVDLNGTAAAGELLMLAESLPGGGPSTFSSSRDGKVIALMDGERSMEELILVDRSGKTVSKLVLEGGGSIGHPEFSPDGKRLLFERSQPSSPGDLWTYDLERRNASRLTFSPEWDGAAVWSADGDRVYYFAQRANQRGIFQIEANGVGTEKLISQTGAAHMHTSPEWSAPGV
jgi:serine/threonine protein kinase